AGGAVRLLHPRHDRARAGVAREESGADGRRDPQGAQREFVPLRDAHAHTARGAARGAELQGGQVMSRAVTFHPSRRRFLAKSGALVVSFALARYADAQPASAPGSLAKTPNLDSWIRVDADGAITV